MPFFWLSDLTGVNTLNLESEVCENIHNAVDFIAGLRQTQESVDSSLSVAMW